LAASPEASSQDTLKQQAQPTKQPIPFAWQQALDSEKHIQFNGSSSSTNLLSFQAHPHLQVVGNVVSVGNVSDARQRNRLGELLREGWQPRLDPPKHQELQKNKQALGGLSVDYYQ
jgi:hypothetical protein